jgi:hypothetical protein
MRLWSDMRPNYELVDSQASQSALSVMAFPKKRPVKRGFPKLPSPPRAFRV